MRFALLFSVAILGSASEVSIAQAANFQRMGWSVSDRLTISQVHRDIWIHTTWQILEGGYRFPANGLVVRNGNELILVDTAWGVDATQELLDWIAAEIELPVTDALITHFHDDSMGGTPALAARGIPFHGHDLTIELGEREAVPLPASLGSLDVGAAVEVPRLEVFYPGPGHSDDNLVVWIPVAKLLFGSCAVRSPTFPGTGNTKDANLSEWPRAVRRVLDRYSAAQIVVPGHGPPGDIALLTHTIGLFDD